MGQRYDDMLDTLRQRVVAGLHLGVLAPGDRLPGVRTLAAEFDADPRVVLTACRRLEVEGLIETRPRSGMYVARTESSASEMLPQMAAWVTEVLLEGLSRWIAPVDLPQRMEACLTTVRLRAACVECNRDQIAGLCGEAERGYGLVPSGVDLDELDMDDPPDAVLQADVLLTTSFHEAEMRALATRLGKACVIVSLRPGFAAEIVRYLEQGPVWFVATDARFAKKLPRMFAHSAHADRIVPLIIGRNDLTGIPADAPVCVMEAAWPHVAEVPALARVIPAAHVFSEETARALLSLIIRSNMDALAAREALPAMTLARRSHPGPY